MSIKISTDRMIGSLLVDTWWYYVHTLSLEYGRAAYMLSRKQSASKKCMGVFFSIEELYEGLTKLGASEAQLASISEGEW